MKKTLLIVLYKEDVYSSKSIKSFLKAKPQETKLVVWDNSPNQLPDEQIEYLREHLDSIQYVHTSQNLSLSKIYNKVWSDNSDCELLYIFDQDSDFTSDYFEKSVKAYSENEDIGLFIPYVKVSAKLVSPGYFKNYKGCYFDELTIGRIKSKNTLAIASGMVIAIKRVGELRFDENLSFYGIDTKFSLDYGDNFVYLYVLEYRLNHNLSEFENIDIDNKIRRLKAYKSSALYILKKRSSFYYVISYVIWTLKILKLEYVKK